MIEKRTKVGRKTQNIRWPLALMMLCLTSIGFAQTEEAPAPPIEIFGDNGQLDVPSGAYVLTGNVRIVRGTLNVLADEARSFTGESGEIERVELYGTPTRWNDTLEDGSEVQGQSEQILYDFVTNLITMDGNAEIQNIQGQFSGDQLVYDLDTQNLVGEGGVRLLIEPATAAAATEQIESSAAEPDDASDQVLDDQNPENDAQTEATPEEPSDDPSDGNG